MGRTGTTWRVLARALVLVALAASGLSWAQSPLGGVAAEDTALTLTGPPGLAVDAALSGRDDRLSGISSDHQTRSMPRSEPAVVAGIGLLVAAGILVLARSSSLPGSTRGRQAGVALRAPPPLRHP